MYCIFREAILSNYRTIKAQGKRIVMKEIEVITVGTRIRECKKKRGMTQGELDEKLCCKKSIITQYEKNKVDIKGSVIVGLAGVLDSTAGYLLNGEYGYELNSNDREIINLL